MANGPLAPTIWLKVGCFTTDGPGTSQSLVINLFCMTGTYILCLSLDILGRVTSLQWHFESS